MTSSHATGNQCRNRLVRTVAATTCALTVASLALGSTYSVANAQPVASAEKVEKNVQLPVPSALAEQGLTGVIRSADYNPAPGAIRNTFGAPGSHAVATTKESRTCTSLGLKIYNTVMRLQHGHAENPPCYDTLPEGKESPIGTQLIYPRDIASMSKAPLIVLSPGIATEPGILSRQAELYASHGYVVSLGYSFTNWFGGQVERAAAEAVAANKNPQSPLFGKIDTSRTILAGHSAGGGSVARVADTIEKGVHKAGDADFTVKGVVAVNPGPSDFGAASPAVTKPFFVILAENESLVPFPLSRVAYDRATGPKWWGVLNGSFHGTYLDDPSSNALGALVLSFAEYNLTKSARSTAVYEGNGLATDREMSKVERSLGKN